MEATIFIENHKLRQLQWIKKKIRKDNKNGYKSKKKFDFLVGNFCEFIEREIIKLIHHGNIKETKY